MGQANLKVFISEYYKKLFGVPVPAAFSMIETMMEDMPQISPLENSILASTFTEKEVFDAISQMEHNKAPGPDGFCMKFTKKIGMLSRQT